MKILITSDGHNSFAFDKIFETEEQFDAAFFLGDGRKNLQDMESVLACPVYSVGGNCDVEGKLFDTACFYGHKIFFTHGHMYGVNSDLFRLNQEAEKQGADIVLYGHTHIPAIDFYENKCFINPGSPTRPRGTVCGTYAILKLDEKTVYPYIVEI